MAVSQVFSESLPIKVFEVIIFKVDLWWRPGRFDLRNLRRKSGYGMSLFSLLAIEHSYRFCID